jgi:hypothetical protein
MSLALDVPTRQPVSGFHDDFRQRWMRVDIARNLLNGQFGAVSQG